METNMKKLFLFILPVIWLLMSCDLVYAQNPSGYPKYQGNVWINGKERIKDSLGVDGTMRVTGATVLYKVTIHDTTHFIGPISYDTVPSWLILQDTIVAHNFRSIGPISSGSTMTVWSTAAIHGKQTNSDSLVALSLRSTGPIVSGSTITSYGKVTDTDSLLALALRSTGTITAGSTINAYGKITTTDSLLAIRVRSSGAVTAGTTLTAYGATSLYGLTTYGENGLLFTLHAITAGDSTFLHTIVDAADTTLKTWSGTDWKTIMKLK